MQQLSSKEMQLKVRWGKSKKLYNGIVVFLPEESHVKCGKPTAESKRERKRKAGIDQPKARPKKIGKYIHAYMYIYIYTYACMQGVVLVEVLTSCYGICYSKSLCYR